MGLLLPAFGRPGAWKRALAVMGMFVAVAIMVTGSPVPAAADPRLSPVRIATGAGGDTPADEAPEGPLTAADPITAMSIARLENQPVEVMSERTETTTVFALPDGTMAAGVASGPVRVLTGGDGLDPGDWAATDETLSAGEDGAVRPAAHVGQLELSGGTPAGTPEDATVEVMAMTTADGTRTTLEWEGPLPAPRLEGARAVYEEVRPGIDMVVEATATGAEQFFVVKEPPAEGEDLVLPVGLSTQGAALAPTADGAIEVVDETGEVVGRSLEPAMWDAAADADRVHPVSEPWEPLDAALRQPPAMPDWAAARAAARSGAGRAPETPGDRRATPQASDGPDGRVPAFVDQVVVERNTEHVDADSVQVDLTPQQEFLTDPGTEYPVIVDPAFNVFAYFDTWVQSGQTGDLSASGELLIGTWNGGATKTRAFANFQNTSFAGATVLSAGLYLIEHHSASCTPRNWQVWGTGLATTATRWSNQPAWVKLWTTSSATTGYSASCPDGQVGADVKGLLVEAAAAPSGSVFVVGLKAESETDNLGFKRFYSNESGLGPWIWLNYNFPPTAGGLRVSGALNPATSGTWTNTLRPTLSATLSDNDGGALTGTFRLRRQGTTTNLWTGTVSNINSGAAGSVQVPAGLLADGQVYEFSVTSNDGSLTGPASPWFTFGVDVTAPLGPVVSSSTHGLVWGQTETGNGTFVATMKTPDAGVISYQWGLDAAPDPNQKVTVTNGAAGTMTVAVGTPGRHLLNVQSRDRAGNLSGVVSYGFYVGHGGLIGPDEGAQVVRRVRLTVDNDPTLPYVRFQWRRSPDIPESAAQVVASSHLTTSTGRPWPSSGWGTIPAAGGYTTWDAGQTLGFVGGPVQVRAQLAADASGSQSSYTQWVTITVDPDADGAATTAIGPGA